MKVLLLLASAAAWAAGRDYDVQHYRIELRFDLQTHSFRGETTVTILPLKEGLNTCELDAETFQVTGVKDGRGALRFQQQPGRLLVQMRTPGHRNRKTEFTVSYVANNVNIDPTKFGMQAGYDLGLSFKEETPQHPALINTLSFPEGARHWFPSNDHPADKATAEIVATVPENYQAIANGRLAGVSHVGREKTFRWMQDRPHSTYLFVLVAGPYVKVQDTNGKLPVNYWVYPKDVNDAPRTFGRTREIIRFFENEYEVPFPWVKYDQITIPRFGGGAESTSATVIGDGAIHDEKADKDFPSHWLVAHEAAHQWWGDLVTMRDWGETWINESFATYGEYLYSKHSLGDDEGALNLHLKRSTYFEEARTKYKRPIVWKEWKTPNQNFDRHTYQKGAAVLHMLRWLMGDSQFKKSVTAFLTRYAYQPADTDDFRKTIVESTGQNFDWFLQQWLYQPGHPVFDVRSEWLPSEKKIRLTVDQKQTPLFETPVDVGIVTGAGPRVERLRIEKKTTNVFEIPCEAKPLMVRFDHGNHLLMELAFSKEVSELLYQLENDDAMGRMWAARELKGRGAEPALRKAAREDKFWAVRKAALESTEGDADFLKACALDSKSDVRAMALRKLGAFREGDFIEARFRAEDSYLAQAEALRALGRTGEKGRVPLLREATHMASPRDVIRQAAQEALRSLGLQ